MASVKEPGGYTAARAAILEIIYDIGPANQKLLSTITGLPIKLVMPLLYDLEDRNYIKVSIDGRLWRVNE